MSIFIINDSILTLHEELEMGLEKAPKKCHFLIISDSSLLPTVALLTPSPLGIIVLHVYAA